MPSCAAARAGAASARRGMKLDQLKPSVAVRGLHHRTPPPGRPRAPPRGPPNHPRPTTPLQFEYGLDEERRRGREVVDHDAHVLHPLDRHALVASGTTAPATASLGSRFRWWQRAAPVPASSGQTIRYRLHRSGDRKLNGALHMILVTRKRTHPRRSATSNAVSCDQSPQSKSRERDQRVSSDCSSGSPPAAGSGAGAAGASMNVSSADPQSTDVGSSTID